mmetsp:Transcript_18761/g.24772  ORF Transcript_18761/g.24772 Transcript_18761/m.24772 type:complete len:279 (-) Transcript_18761:249-1085(-)
MEGEVEQTPNVTPHEEKELRRVFETLCNFHKKRKLQALIQPRAERLEELKKKYTVHDDEEDALEKPLAALEKNAEKDKSEAVLDIDADNPDYHEMKILEQEIDQYKKELEEVEAIHLDSKIRANDLSEALKFLGKKTTKKEVQDIIWEVDENLDQCVDWEEFQLMFERNTFDKTGLEPSQLYHMVQFLMYDNKNAGTVTVDETMGMLFARYGRTKMEAKLRTLFGQDMKESGTEGGEISFLQYLEAVQKTQMETFLATSLGKKVAKKLGEQQEALSAK